MANPKSINEFFPNLGASSDPALALGGDWLRMFVDKTQERAVAKARAGRCPALVLEGNPDEAARLMRNIDAAETEQSAALGVILAANLAEKASPAVSRLVSAVSKRIKCHLESISHPEGFLSRPRSPEYKRISDAYWASEAEELDALGSCVETASKT